MKKTKWTPDEKTELMNWLNTGWDHVFPGYDQASLYINRLFNNNRTASACRSMDRRISIQTKKHGK